MRLLIDFNTAILILTTACNLTLAIFFYRKEVKSEIIRSFAGFTFFTAFWAFTSFLFVRVDNLEWILTIRRLIPGASALIAAYFLYFTRVFPEGKIRAWEKNAILLPGYFFAFISVFTPFLISTFIVTSKTDLFLGNPVFGGAYRIYALYLVVYFVLGLGMLARKLIFSEGIQRAQTLYVFAGTLVAVIGGLVLSLIMPLFHLSQLFTLGPPMSLIMVGAVMYAIVKYRFLDTEDFLIYGLTYFSAIAAGMILLLYWFGQQQQYILPTGVVLANLYLGIMVYIRNWKNAANRWFCILSISVSAWSYFLMLFQMEQSYIYAQLAFVAAIFIPSVFSSFVRVFPSDETKIKPDQLDYLVYGISIILSILVFENLIITGLEEMSWGTSLALGPLYYSYALGFIGIFVLALGRLFRKYFRAQGIDRMQIRYVFLGVTLGAVLGATFSLVLPIWMPQVYPLGIPSTLVMVGFISYAIIKHRLLSVEIIIQRGLIYSVMTIVLVAIYETAIYLFNTNLNVSSGPTQLLALTVTSFLLAIMALPALNWLRGVSDRVFFRAHYDYQKTIREVSQAIVSVVNLNQIIRIIITTLIKTMRASEASFLVHDEVTHRFRSVAVELDEGASRYKHIEIDASSAVITLLKASADVLIYDELEMDLRTNSFLGPAGKRQNQLVAQALEEMRQLGALVWVPVMTKGKLITLITLGKKISSDVYTTDDIALLKTLSGQVGLAIENTGLYEEVLSAKNYTQNILESMVNGIITTDLNEKIITCNPECEKMLGVHSHEILRKTLIESWPDNQGLAQIISNTLKDRCYHNFETQIVSKAHGMMPVSINTNLLRDSRGKRIGALISITDISERRTLESKVRQADKLAALGTMAAGMAHEIKNPLSSMKVLSQLFPLKYQDEEYRKKYMEIMPKEISRIDRIVENLLGFARASSLKFENVKVESLLDETLNYYSEQIKNNKIVIDKQYSDTPEITADGGQLSQVFSNFILNAIQAMPSGGKISITTVVGGKNNAYVDVTVSDSGVGISKDNLKKLFDPFFTTKYGGTGLGLTISHSIINGHRGFVDVSSEVGKGTTFKVSLPIKQEESA